MSLPAAAAPLARRLSYAQCWEDPAVLLDALSPLRGSRVLSIASAGDNSIALALAGADVVAVDLSAPQLAVTELKLAGWRLDYHDFLVLLGLDEGDSVAQYRRLRPGLSASCRHFFDAHGHLLERGLLSSGRFERYLALFRRRMLPLVHGRGAVQAMLEPMSPDQRRRFYDERWDGWRWRLMFRVFFSRRVMERLGRSPEQFQQVSGAVASRFMERARDVLRDGLVDANPFVSWILTGSYRDLELGHPYLSRRGHAALQEAWARVRLLHISLEEHLQGCPPAAYDAFNLSNMPEYLDSGSFETLYGALLRAAAPGARLGYWNLLVDRRCPERFAGRVSSLQQDGAALLQRDRVPFYSAFRLEVVR